MDKSSRGSRGLPRLIYGATVGVLITSIVIWYAAMVAVNLIETINATSLAMVLDGNDVVANSVIAAAVIIAGLLVVGKSPSPGRWVWLGVAAIAQALQVFSVLQDVGRPMVYVPSLFGLFVVLVVCASVVAPLVYFQVHPVEKKLKPEPKHL